ncbi:MAG: putative phosphotriesterase, partial [Mycobacterium sp.]|nr:putative phosphotriesterase [Mycobacterium sp.]
MVTTEDGSTVNTAAGAIGATELGVTLMHEHVFIMSTEIMENYPESWGDG